MCPLSFYAVEPLLSIVKDQLEHTVRNCNAMQIGLGLGWVSSGLRITSYPRLTFDQGMLIRGRGASQHPQLWPNLVNPLLLNLERSVVCRWGHREKSYPMQSHWGLQGTPAGFCSSMQDPCLPAPSRVRPHCRAFAVGACACVPPPSRCGSSD